MLRSGYFSFLFYVILFFSIDGLTADRTYMKCMDTTSGPEPCGPYCSAIRVNSTLHLSGVIAIDKETNKVVTGGIKHETEVIFKHIRNILKECGSSFDKVATVKIYLEDINDAKAVNDLYQTYFLHPFPARSMMQVAKLPGGAKIEVEVMAVITDEGRKADPPT